MHIHLYLYVSRGLYSSHVWMWELDYKESWVPKNWCFWTMVLENSLESPLDCKEIQPVNPKGNQSWIFLEGLMLKLKFQYFGHLMWRTDSLEKTLMPGKIEGRRRRGRERMRWLDGITDWTELNWTEDHGIQSHHFMANRWEISGTCGWLYFWGAKVTTDGDCSHEIKRCLLLGRKVMTNLDSMLKSRDIALPTKVLLVKLWFFQ